jgi:hypothetical protein
MTAMNCESTGFIFQDLLLLIGLKARTGELVIESGNNIGSMIFHNGNVLQAYSPYSRAIGDLLVEKGVISEAELLEFLLEQKKNNNAPLGSLLVKREKVGFSVIEAMVQKQIRESVKDFTVWKNLTISFVEKEIRPFDSIHLSTHEFILPETLKSASQFFAGKLL